MDSGFTVLGIAADPRIYGDSTACASPDPPADQSPVLTYTEQKPEHDSGLFLLELVCDADVLFELLELGVAGFLWGVAWLLFRYSRSCALL